MKKRGLVGPRLIVPTTLLFVIFLLRLRGFAYRWILCFRLFHGFASFRGSLGAGFGSLLAFLVEHLLASKQFNESLVSAIALLKAGTDDAEVAAITVSETGTDGVEKLGHGFLGHQVRHSLTASGEVAAFPQGNHFLYVRPHGLGLGNRGLDTLFENQRRDQIAQQRATMARVPS